MHRNHHEALDRAVQRAALPGPPRTTIPFGENVAKAVFLAVFGAKSLNHRVATDRVSKRAAELGIPGIRELGRRRDVTH